MSAEPTLLLVHGAGSGPSIWAGWRGEAVDLHAGLNVAAASLLNYEAVLTAAAALRPRPLVVVGWSMGGLVAMMAARRVEPDGLVLLEPSPPAEVQGVDPDAAPAKGVYDPEDAYGPFPGGLAGRPESLLARSERKRGVSVPELPFRTLVVYGDGSPEVRGRRVAAYYRAEERPVPGASHWDLVLGSEARYAVEAWARSDSASPR